MHSSMIGKLEKARRYADEPWRVTLQELKVTFNGDNDTHEIIFDNGMWQCKCRFFETNQTCAHVMAVQHIMDRALDKDTVDHRAHLLRSR